MKLSTYKALLRITKPINSHLGVYASRFNQDILMLPMLKAFNVKPDSTVIKGNGYRLIQANTKQKTNTAILYLHGGAYVAGGKGYVKGVSNVLANRLGHNVYGLVYSLAPEHPYPAALNDALDAYKYLLDKYSRIILLGDSAGGGMVFSLCSMINQQALRPANGLVAFSPWTDLTFSGESLAYNKRNDPSISIAYLKRSAKHYIKNESPACPLISPVFCDCNGFPKTLIYVGGLEILLSDAENMQKNLLEYGVNSKLTVGEGMWHVYPLFLTSPNEQLYIDIKEFIEND